jgi:hypothetical protein
MDTEKDFSGFFQENKALLKEYLELRFQLIKLQGVRILSRTLSLFIVIITVGIFALFVVLFLGLSFAWWLSEETGSNTLGFAGAAGLFTILLIIVIAFRKPLFQSPLIRMFIHESTKDMEEKE